MSKQDFQQYLDVAVAAARTAGAFQMQNYAGDDLQVRTKSSGLDLVTMVDIECDRLISHALHETFPDTLLVTEESYHEGSAIDLSNTWVVDPLDGTTNYTHSFPHFAVSIAYFKDNKPRAGVVFDPFKQEMFTAIEGGGAFLNDKPIRVSKVETLLKALLATGFPYNLDTNARNNLDYFKQVLPKCHGVRRPGAAALDLAYTACGRLDGFWELTLSPWDVAAGGLLIEEAGGVMADLSGEPLDYSKRRIDLIGANHEEMLRALVTTLHGTPVSV